MSIQRFEPELVYPDRQDAEWVKMELDDEGGWVSYEDYLALSAKLNAMNSQCIEDCGEKSTEQLIELSKPLKEYTEAVWAERDALKAKLEEVQAERDQQKVGIQNLQTLLDVAYSHNYAAYQERDAAQTALAALEASRGEVVKPQVKIERFHRLALTGNMQPAEDGGWVLWKDVQPLLSVERGEVVKACPKECGALDPNYAEPDSGCVYECWNCGLQFDEPVCYQRILKKDTE